MISVVQQQCMKCQSLRVIRVLAHAKPVVIHVVHVALVLAIPPTPMAVGTKHFAMNNGT